MPKSFAHLFHSEFTAWGVLVVSLIITALGWYIAEQYSQQRAADRFAFEVEDARNRIIERMLEYEQVLRGGIALFNTVDRPVTRAEWRSYVTTLDIQTYFPGIQGIGFARIITPEDLAAHVESIRNEGFPDYRVRPENQRDIYSAIEFLEPFDWRNKRAFGYDMYSEPVRRAAMQQATDSGQPAVSGRVTLVQETEEDIQAGFLMYLPLYQPGRPTTTVEQRREALLGFVYSPFRIKDLMHGILGRGDTDLDFELYDGLAAQTSASLLYRSNDAPQQTAPRYSAFSTLELPGRTWTAHFSSRPSFDSALESYQPEIIAFGGITVDILLFLVIFSIAGERKRVQRKADAITATLRERKQRLKVALDSTQSGIWDLDLEYPHMFWDERMYALYGLKPADAENLYETWKQRVHPDDLEPILKQLEEAIASGENFACQFRILRPDGTQLFIDANAVVRYDETGKAVRVTGINRDITERKLDEERLRLSASVFHYAHEGIAITDAESRIIDVNPTFTAITGYDKEEVLGKTPGFLSSGYHGEDFYDELWKSLKQDGHWRGEIWNRRKNGESFAELLTISTVHDRNGKVSNYVAVFSDITRLKEQQASLEHLAKYDPLTKLPNRVLLADRMQQAMAATQRSGKLLAVCYLDLDHFKPVNDQHGHHVGDELLISVSQRLSTHLRESDSAARLGGDEFVLLLTQLNSAEECNKALERLLLTLSRPYQLSVEQPVTISASVGVTLYPKDNEDSDTLLRHADQAMYLAKQSGRNRYHLFDPEYDRITRVQIEEISRIESALDADEFILHYQPKVDMRRGEVIGLEALIRWKHPERGLLPPGKFLPMIENSDFSIRLGDWVLEQALQQLSLWHAQGFRIPVSVNISGRHLQQPNFARRLQELLERYPAVSSSQLELEVLETTALEDILLISEVISSCRELGIAFSLDDFGTGYSSLTYLKRLPADTLKIDQSFIRDMLEDPEDLAIIEGIIGLARAFHRQVIAEGVESLEHGALLLHLGCELGQGYGIAKPMPAEEVRTWVDNYDQPEAWATAGGIDWSRNDLPLQTAETDHRRWVDDLITSLEAGTTVVPPPQLDYHRCHFSTWYQGAGYDYYGHLPEYSEIADMHRRIHRLGQEMVELDRNGENELALQQIPQLKALRSQIQERLQMLKAATGAVHPG